MRNYDVIHFCFEVKYAKEYWVSKEYKITNNFNTSHCIEIDIQSQRLAENVLNRASILLSNRIQSFFHCAMDFRTVSMVTSFHLFLIASFRSCRLANGSCQPSYTKSCRISQMQYRSSKALRSGEYDAHSSAAMKSGVYCHRNCCVTFARCDATLSCRNSKSLPRQCRRHSGSKEVFNRSDLVNFCLLQINEKDISFSVPRNSGARYQLF